ncbi:hypothetical protein EF834_13270 [Rhodococcus spongiicola]|uniref:Lipoprotein LpqS n=1 Tax=Rhodococcus spongiicola TaxID=2487352 RepID=A0A438AV30_9NOCA|nr:hypothetical protein EF834_13270 [Rhodococcus spongiicola]
MRMVVAVAATLYLLAHTIAQCGVSFGDDYAGENVHIASFSSSSTLLAHEGAPGHAHIDEGSAPLSHEAHTVVAMPRSDNQLRTLALAAVGAIALAAAVVFVLNAWTPLTPRSPPSPARPGRTVLNELCINRC